MVQAVMDMPGYGEVKVSVLSLTGPHKFIYVGASCYKDLYYFADC